MIKQLLKLNNNYILTLENNYEKYALDIKKLKWKEIKKQNVLFLNIDFNIIKYDEFKKILKHLLKLKKKAFKNKIIFGIIENNKKTIGQIKNFDKNNENHKMFIFSLNAILFQTCYESYNYIYDTVCDYLDKQFIENNLCDFQNNKCGEKRNTSSLVGCCHHYKNSFLGPISLKNNFIQCEYFQGDKCIAKCIGCKLFTCDYLEKKGIKFKIKDILLLDTFFNPIQKYIIKYNVFTPKEIILKRLLLFKTINNINTISFY